MWNQETSRYIDDSINYLEKRMCKPASDYYLADNTQSKYVFVNSVFGTETTPIALNLTCYVSAKKSFFGLASKGELFKYTTVKAIPNKGKNLKVECKTITKVLAAYSLKKLGKKFSIKDIRRDRRSCWIFVVDIPWGRCYTPY